MAVTTALFWFSLVLTIIGSNGSGELNVLHSPDTLYFAGTSKLLESSLKEVFSASLGLSVEENSEWNGLTIVDPFYTPEAAVEVYIDGVSNLGNGEMKAKSFPLLVDEYEPDTFEAVKHRINQRFNNGGNKIVYIDLQNPEQVSAFSSIFGEIKDAKVPKKTLQHLKTAIEEDYNFLIELETLKSITERVRSGTITADNVVDFYYFRFGSLHPLSDFHGPNSLQAKEAKMLLREALEDLSVAFVNAYDGRVLVTAVTTDVAHTRRHVRAVRADDEEIEASAMSDGYDADYAAIFNIMLWFAVVLVFTLVAIVYALMDMDPGRDSIIYRMTNPRMKKDN